MTLITIYMCIGIVFSVCRKYQDDLNIKCFDESPDKLDAAIRASIQDQRQVQANLSEKQKKLKELVSFWGYAVIWPKAAAKFLSKMNHGKN